jgi:hypothetical protein
MKFIFKQLSKISFVFLFFIVLSARASDLPDPELLAKQYLKDLCTLNEQDFTRKYMLTQLDAEDFMKNLNKAYTDVNEEPSEEFSDSLAIRSQIHSLVVKSYRAFKVWQHENNIDSSKIKYNSCEFELEKRRKIPYYSSNDMQIYFSYDTINYSFSCDDFLYLKTKWIGGDSEGIHKVDKYFNEIYNDYDYEYTSDTTVVVSDYEEENYESTEGNYADEAPTKKQLKIQKKIDVYNRKIDALYIKQYE